MLSWKENQVYEEIGDIEKGKILKTRWIIKKKIKPGENYYKAKRNVRPLHAQVKN